MPQGMQLLQCLILRHFIVHDGNNEQVQPFVLILFFCPNNNKNSLVPKLLNQPRILNGSNKPTVCTEKLLWVLVEHKILYRPVQSVVETHCPGYRLNVITQSHFNKSCSPASLTHPQLCWMTSPST